MRGWGIFAKGWFLLELAIPFYHDRRRVEDHPKIYELWDNLIRIVPEGSRLRDMQNTWRRSRKPHEGIPVSVYSRAGRTN
jgi:hypothetical protein